MNHPHQIKHGLIFIVEDDEMYSVMLDYLLSQELNCNFASYRTGEECIRNISLRPDIIILDYDLPGMNGISTFKKIKELDPTIRVIVVTGKRDPQVAVDFLEAGVDDYLLKGEETVRELRSIISGLLVHFDDASG